MPSITARHRVRERSSDGVAGSKLVDLDRVTCADVGAGIGAAHDNDRNIEIDTRFVKRIEPLVSRVAKQLTSGLTKFRLVPVFLCSARFLDRIVFGI